MKERLLYFLWKIGVCGGVLLTCIFILGRHAVYAQRTYYPGGLTSTNISLWLNASVTSSVNTTGSAVTSWNDLSGNGYNATQGTAGNRPAYSSTGSTTGKPEITFTRANSQYLQIASLASTFAPGTLSVFSVARFANSSSCTGCSYERIFDFGGGSASDNILIARSGATSNVDFSIYSSSTGGDRASSSSFSTNTFIFDVVTSSTTPNFYFNGTADNSASGSNQTAQSLARTINYIGRSNWSADAYLQGGVSELLFFKVNLNNTQRILVENYQAAQWGLLSSLSSLKYVPTSTTTYNTNLLGIGRQSSSDNVPSTLSGDGFSLSSTVGAGNFLQDDGDYFIIRKTKSAKKHPSNLKKILQNHYEKRGQNKPL